MRIVRIVTVLLCAIFSYFAFANSMASIADLKNPPLALKFDDESPRALAVSADLAFSQKNQTQALTLARQSLSALAINPVALRVFGMSVPGQGNRKKADALTLSEKLSRRDAATQLLLLEQAARSSDLPLALHHIDTVLRTTSTVQPELYRRLATTLVEKDMRAALRDVVRRNPAWLPGFLDQISSTPQQVKYIADVVVQAGGLPADPNYRAREEIIFQSLFDQHQYDLARRLFSTMPDAKSPMLTDIALTEDNFQNRFIPLSWRLDVSPEISAGTALLNKKIVVEVMAGPENGGVFARKMAFFQPGTYKLLYQGIAQNSANNKTLNILGRCAVSGDYFLQEPMILDSKNIAEKFVTIPSGCTVQEFSLSLNSSVRKSVDDGDYNATVTYLHFVSTK